SLPVASAPASDLEPPAPLPSSRDRNDDPLERAREAAGQMGRAVAATAAVDPHVSRAALTTDSPSAPASPAASERGPDDWGTIRQKMRELGVARYGIEGEPDGRARFHCVIPLAGRRAVSQQFEADGSDALEAAQATLRRVALWRATEPPVPTEKPAK